MGLATSFQNIGFWVGRGRRCKACAAGPIRATTTTYLADLKKHADVVAPSVAVGEGENGRGLIFTDDRPEGTVVSIPLKNVLLVTDDPVESQSITGESPYDNATNYVIDVSP